MSEQNVYDNQEFFDGYMSLRKREDNYNDLLEQPAMAQLLPDLQEKTVLDLGCGYGRNCMDFVHKGAARVVGVDISSKMTDIAKKEYADKKIEYINISMTEIASINETFDLVYSSLAFHYIEDFNKLIKNIYGLLNPGGHLLFSQEHPIITATVDGKGYFNKNEKGEKISYTFSNYNQSGKRRSYWIVDGVIKYHRTMGEIITSVAKNGFVIETLCEPIPQQWAVEKLPAIAKEFIKPNFMIVRAKKRVK